MSAAEAVADTPVNPFQDIWDNQPAAPARCKTIEIDVVAKRCVYINSHRVAGGKPYFSENLPQHTLKTTLGEVLDAFSDKEVKQALREKVARQKYFAAYHASKAAS